MSPTEFIHKVKAEAPASLTEDLTKLEINYSKRLYHQLTKTLQEIIQKDDISKYLVDLWNNFISTFKDKLNQLRLVEIGVRVAQEMIPQESLNFLESLLDTLPVPRAALPPALKPTNTKSFDEEQPPTKTESEAYVLAKISIAHYDLLLGNLDKAKEAMDVCERVLDSIDGVEASVTGAWLRVSGDYFKSKAEYAAFYRTTLLYISCAGMDQLDKAEQIQRSHDLAIAALLGDTIYNFGELLTHPILHALDGTELEWLKDIIYIFNEGDITKFEVNASKLANEPILHDSQAFLRQKICLMALIECVFKRSSKDRDMSFSTIGAETKLPLDEVEHLIMKALSLKLIRGTIDQVSSSASINWVQPRVLDKNQVKSLASRLNEWRSKVENVAVDVNSQAPELFA
ncbi:hypothetical protein WALSEDRAFT_31005 [Wallemia mellicola CBS 633.66]|uniref:PCI domain-containing protein n=1 Tax=Wallemia mellicola (strain ATCC MYA-4683 / CBS 633.66) TaxID=671144 RepID=I4YHN4_WALMC|nr:hypothetical protein WALSEDRAFT_31005 [Wallemia mellicola CBS 633.66]EIM23476.1 hypothetical protein WALSEDRAFT_31005 [Wallemia mellicola CBS 633.66]|eukprot:XP_006956155.1 hypothetical protein WALSEDRAFT_31005 [Wallemia mellicola CBS 633.66]